MYNRYIGNTGKFYRVDDSRLPELDTQQRPAAHHENNVTQALPVHDIPQPHPAAPFPFPGKELAGSLKGILGNFIPEGMEIGDLLLMLVLLLLYLEKEDEEILIILSVLIFSGFR